MIHMFFHISHSAVTRADGVRANLNIAFNRNTPTAELPQNSAVAQALVSAANSTNNFTVSFNPNGVSAVGKSVILPPKSFFPNFKSSPWIGFK